jgi:hypothetical protein
MLLRHAPSKRTWVSGVFKQSVAYLDPYALVKACERSTPREHAQLLVRFVWEVSRFSSWQALVPSTRAQSHQALLADDIIVSGPEDLE